MNNFELYAGFTIAAFGVITTLAMLLQGVIWFDGAGSHGPVSTFGIYLIIFGAGLLLMVHSVLRMETGETK